MPARRRALLHGPCGRNAGLGESKITVFYLKYAKADVAASLIQQILSGGAGSSSGSIGSLMGDITGNLMGGGGGLMGMLLGTGGDAGAGDTMGATFEATSTVSIVADPRLNALVVQAVYISSRNAAFLQ